MRLCVSALCGVRLTVLRVSAVEWSGVERSGVEWSAVAGGGAFELRCCPQRLSSGSLLCGYRLLLRATRSPLPRVSPFHASDAPRRGEERRGEEAVHVKYSSSVPALRPVRAAVACACQPLCPLCARWLSSVRCFCLSLTSCHCPPPVLRRRAALIGAARCQPSSQLDGAPLLTHRALRC